MRSPQPTAVLELLKPVTWFAATWAFGCGVVSGGLFALAHGKVVVAGIARVGPLIRATSQAVIDWYDRDVDAINAPDRAHDRPMRSDAPAYPEPAKMGGLLQCNRNNVVGLGHVAERLRSSLNQIGPT